MIHFEKIKVYDKHGYDLQWTPTSLLKIKITSTLGKGYEIYPYLSVNNNLGGFYVKDGGYGFGTYQFKDDDGNLQGIDIDIDICELLYEDELICEVPIRNITFKSVDYTDMYGYHQSLGIKEISTEGISFHEQMLRKYNLSFPSLTFTGAIFMDRVSANLVETESLHFFYESENTLEQMYDNEDNGNLSLGMGNGDSEIQLFEIESSTNTIYWCESVEHEIPSYKNSVKPEPISFNIGFKSEDEGVYENSVNVYYNINNKYYLFGEIILNAESIGEDERFRTLLANFGIPDPKDFPEVIKDSDINEALIDWNIVNSKSKEFFLEYDNIFKFCGTYKGLINAVKILGYDDIYFREWFLDTKTSTKKTFKVPYGNNGVNSIKSLPLIERKSLKKLNSLSMVFNLNKETDKYDDNNTPIVENVYQNNLNEVRVKLMSLKDWLEKNIIGVNCRITDLSAEGVYFNTYNNNINGMTNTSFEIEESVELTPIISNEIDNYLYSNSYVISKEENKNAFIPFSVLETNDTLTTNDIGNKSAKDFINGSASNPLFNDISDFMWRASISTKSTILPENVATNGLWVYNNTLKIKSLLTNIDNSENMFSEFLLPKTINGNKTGNRINVIIEHAYLRDTITNEILYTFKLDDFFIEEEVNRISTDINTGNVSVYKDIIPKKILKYKCYDKDNNLLIENDTYLILKFDENSSFKYMYNNNEDIRTYTLQLENFYLTLSDGAKYKFNNSYTLELIDGKISIEPLNNKTEVNKISYINFNYDIKGKEQTIECNHVYNSPRISVLKNGIPNLDYDLEVEYVGKYEVELIIWNNKNNIFINKLNKDCSVICNKPSFSSYKAIDSRSNEEYESDIISNISDSPIYDFPSKFDVLNIKEGCKEYSVEVESKSYINKLPYVGAYVDIIDRNYGKNIDFNLSVSNIDKKYVTDEYILCGLEYIDTNNNIFKIGDIVNLDISLLENYSNPIFTNSCTVRIEDIHLNTSGRNSIFIKYDIIPKYIINNPDDFSIHITPAWKNIDNIETFRIESATEYEYIGNKILFDFKYDNYILPYIDRHFSLSIEDFKISDIKDRWNNDIIGVVKQDMYDVSYNGTLILAPDIIDDGCIYIWTVYTNKELFYRLYNKVISLKYDPEIIYNVVLERVDEKGNVCINKYDGCIKIKETE